MRLHHVLALGAALLLAAAGVPAAAQTTPAPGPAQPAPQPAAAGPLYVFTYFDVAPAAARKVTTVLRQYAGATHKEAGNLEVTALHEIARPGRFALVEAWQNKAALDAHGAQSKGLADKLQSVAITPFDPRQFVPLMVAGPMAGANLTGAIYVLTHVDVFPPAKEQAAGLVKQQVEDSRKDPGVLRYDAVLWDGHPNHFHLIEAWANRGLREAHAMADHSRQFRTKVAPFEGALYDERLYEAVR